LSKKVDRESKTDKRDTSPLFSGYGGVLVFKITFFVIFTITMSSGNLQEQKRVFTVNREFIVDNLEADDVIDELIQEKLVGHNAAHRLQLVGMNRVDKNRIIVDQLCTAGPGALEKFCHILRRNERQVFIAEELQVERCE